MKKGREGRLPGVAFFSRPRLNNMYQQRVLLEPFQLAIDSQKIVCPIEFRRKPPQMLHHISVDL